MIDININPLKSSFFSWQVSKRTDHILQLEIHRKGSWKADSLGDSIYQDFRGKNKKQTTNIFD